MFIVVLEYIFIFMLLYTSTVLDRRMKQVCSITFIVTNIKKDQSGFKNRLISGLH